MFRFPMKFPSSLKRPDRLWFPPSFLFHGYRDLIPLRKAPGASPHSTEITIRGAMPTIHMISRCAEEKLQIHFISLHDEVCQLQQDRHNLLSIGCLSTSLRNQAITPILCCGALLDKPSYAYMTWHLSVPDTGLKMGCKNCSLLNKEAPMCKRLCPHPRTATYQSNKDPSINLLLNKDINPCKLFNQ